MIVPGRNGKRALRDGCRAIINEVPSIYPWCKMLIAPVKVISVYNLCVKMGFKDGGLADYPPDKAKMMVINYG